jgi:SAM-dependent methyltransferase
MEIQPEASSFRDKSGYIFYYENRVFRAIHSSYRSSFENLISSGLYQSLVSKKLLLPHQISNDNKLVSLGEDVYKVIEVEKIPFISYPYEWSFMQLKQAALLTLQIQVEALKHGMTLKDGSAYNIQFLNGVPVFIDTLSFDAYEEGKPWVAYRQFCRHFLAPLALISKVNPDLRQLSQLHIDGVPLQLASSLLPYKTRFSPFYQMHIHYHAKMEMKYSADVKASDKLKLKLSKSRLLAILNHLESGIRSMTLPEGKTEWSDYYNEFNYSDNAIAHKKILVKEWTEAVAPRIVWDLGCNTGMFSELIQSIAKEVVSFDIDYLAIEKFTRLVKEKKYKNILPLVMDLNNPSPAIGWANQERKSFVERGPADLLLALALIHHLSIGNNLPFSNVAELFSQLGSSLIIEFVPKTDEQAQRLLVTREDIFTDYHEEAFELAFSHHFNIINKLPVEGTERVLYLMKRK